MKKNLFVCVGKCRQSQMAKAFAKKFGKNKFEEFSAGNKPTSNVNLMVWKQ